MKNEREYCTLTILDLLEVVIKYLLRTRNIVSYFLSFKTFFSDN